jgi:lipid-binding SYLF domain-containing protein
MSIRLLVCAAAIAAAASAVTAQKAEAEKIATSITVLEDAVNIPEETIPERLLDNAQAIAILPGVKKGAFMLGGEYGSGVLVMRQGEDEWSPPVFITIAGASVGWQLGAQSTDVVLVFKTRRSAEGLLDGKLTLGGDAAVAAGPVGRDASASTDAQLDAEIYSYARSRGLFAGISLQGNLMRIDESANSDFYGQDDVAAEEIVRGDLARIPPEARRLQVQVRKLLAAPAGEPAS